MIINTCLPKSTHRVEVVPFAMTKHPDADKLSVVQVFGYQCVVATDCWPADTTKAAYLPPDSVVDVTLPEFAFLAPQAKGDGKARIKAKNLRGIQSFGCLFPIPDHLEIGQDVAELYGVGHYEPPTTAEKQLQKGSYLGGVEDEDGPVIQVPKYDLDAFRRYHELFQPGEPVVVTEKLDGANAAFVYLDGRMHCRSRTTWKREFSDTSHITREYLVEKGCPEERVDAILEKNAGRSPKKNAWWAMLEQAPSLMAFCRANPGTVVFGELYGSVNCIKYGLPQDQFAAFDLFQDGKYVPPIRARERLGLWGVPMVPLFNEVEATGEGPRIRPISYDFEAICAMADGPTLVPDAKPGVIREGVVVSPWAERYDPRLGRVKLKAVGATFLEKYR